MRNFNELYKEAQDLSLLHRGCLPEQKLKAFLETCMYLKMFRRSKRDQYLTNTITTIKPGPENFYLYLPNLFLFKNTRFNLMGEHILTPKGAILSINAFYSEADHNDPRGRKTIARITVSASISLTDEKKQFISVRGFRVRNFQSFQRTQSRTFYRVASISPKDWAGEEINHIKRQIGSSNLHLKSFNIEKFRYKKNGTI
jgi:hypothetical protein